MPSIAGHVKSEELELYCLGGLTEVRCAHLEEHLFLCEVCRDRLTETENYVATMKEAGRRWSAEKVEEPAGAIVPIRRWRMPQRSRLVPISIAAVLLVCAAVWFGRHSSVQAPPFAVELTSVRGAASGRAPADRPLSLKLDLTGLSDRQPLVGEVVDATGSRVAKFPVGAPALLKPLPTGSYFVRLFGASGELLREYALTVDR